mmetsp:Transcript_107144/g.346011  ORF Transcript_107144/g.346011 Transcript_107144/m.346011 type:complete len:280 (-) Transcript_107144:140-979(-)
MAAAGTAAEAAAGSASSAEAVNTATPETSTAAGGGGGSSSSLRAVPAPPSTPAPPSAFGVPAPPLGAPQGEAISTLWIGSLVPDVNDDDIFDAFAPYGFVTDVNMSEQQSASGGLQAYIKYEDRPEAEAALTASLNRQLLVKGKAVTCRWAPRNIVNLAQLKSAAVSAAQSVRQTISSIPERHANVAGSNYVAPKLWIGNLPIGTNENDVRKVCRGVGGELVDIIVHKKPSQYGQLSGFLRFKTLLETEMMMKAISSGAILVNGAILKADWAKGSGPQF